MLLPRTPEENLERQLGGSHAARRIVPSPTALQRASTLRRPHTQSTTTLLRAACILPGPFIPAPLSSSLHSTRHSGSEDPPAA